MEQRPPVRSASGRLPSSTEAGGGGGGGGGGSAESLPVPSSSSASRTAPARAASFTRSKAAQRMGSRILADGIMAISLTSIDDDGEDEDDGGGGGGNAPAGLHPSIATAAGGTRGTPTGGRGGLGGGGSLDGSAPPGYADVWGVEPDAPSLPAQPAFNVRPSAVILPPTSLHLSSTGALVDVPTFRLGDAGDGGSDPGGCADGLERGDLEVKAAHLAVGLQEGHFRPGQRSLVDLTQLPGGGQAHFKHPEVQRLVLKTTQEGTSEMKSISTMSMPSLARRTRGRERSLATTSVHKAFQESQFDDTANPSLGTHSTSASLNTKSMREDTKRGGSGNLLRNSVSNITSRLADVRDRMERTSRPADVEQVLPEYRLRLQAGLKQVFRSKYADGVVCGSSYRILDFICSKGLHHPEHALSLWPFAEAEVSNNLYLTVAARAHHAMRVRLNSLRHSRWWLIRMWAKPLTLPVWAVAWYLNRMMTTGLEVALELWLVLANSPQVHWLEYGGPAGAKLLEEVKADTDAAWAFIMDRRIEAPERFQAIQTYRATVALLHQQQAFVQEMTEGGMIDDSEADRMREVIRKRQQRVERRGASWKHPSLSQILRSTVFLRNQPPEIETWLRANATFKVHKKGDVVWWRDSDTGAPPGIFVVISGLVRCEVAVSTEDKEDHFCFYIGSAGVGGLLASFVQHDLRGVGMRAVYAEGNALGKGPVVMHLPAELVATVRSLAHEHGLPAFQSLHLAMARNVGSYVLDLMKHAVMAQLVQQLSTMMRTALLSRDGEKGAGRDSAERRVLAAKALLQADDASTMECLYELAQLPQRDLTLLLAGLGSAHAALQENSLKALTLRATHVVDAMKAAVPTASLVLLEADQTYRQSATVIIVQGSLRPLPASAAAVQRESGISATKSGGSFTLGRSGRTQPATLASSHVRHKAPSILLWTPEYFEQAAVAPPPPALLIASVGGATLLVLGLGEEDQSTQVALEARRGGDNGDGGGGDLARASNSPALPSLAKGSLKGFGRAPFGGANWPLFGGGKAAAGPR